MSSFPSQLNPVKFQKYVFRLPLFTRIILLLIILFWILELQSAWDVPAWGALIPQKVTLSKSTSIIVPCELISIDHPFQCID